MAIRAEIKLDQSSLLQANKLLDQIDEMVRGPAITQVMRGIGLQIRRDVRESLPKPGYPGDKPELKPLRDTLNVKVKNYQGGSTKVMVVGYAWPTGAHGQPLEAGHEKYLWGELIEGSPVDPHPYMAEVVLLTRNTQSQQLIDGARRALEKIKGNG